MMQKHHIEDLWYVDTLHRLAAQQQTKTTLLSPEGFENLSIFRGNTFYFSFYKILLFNITIIFSLCTDKSILTSLQMVV